jgi:hypothetical protein
MSTFKHLMHTDLHMPHIRQIHFRDLTRDPRFWVITAFAALVLLILTLAMMVSGEGVPISDGFPFGYPYLPAP